MAILLSEIRPTEAAVIQILDDGTPVGNAEAITFQNAQAITDLGNGLYQLTLPTGGGGQVDTLIAGTNITIDATDPANPVISAVGGGSGTVDSIIAGAKITVDNTDPANPIITTTAGVVDSLGAGANITIDNTDPANPVISAAAGGQVDSVVGSAKISIDNTDPANPVITTTAGLVDSLVAGSNITVDATDPANPTISAATGGQVDTLVAGANITIDATDPVNPTIIGPAPGGQVDAVVAGTNITIDNTDPANPVINAIGGGGGTVNTLVAGDFVTVDATDPANPVVTAQPASAANRMFSTYQGDTGLSTSTYATKGHWVKVLKNITVTGVSVHMAGGAGDVVKLTIVKESATTEQVGSIIATSNSVTFPAGSSTGTDTTVNFDFNGVVNLTADASQRYGFFVTLTSATASDPVRVVAPSVYIPSNNVFSEFQSVRATFNDIAVNDVIGYEGGSANVGTGIRMDIQYAEGGVPLSVTGGLSDAPSDGNQYARQDGTWQIVSGGGGGITDAPVNGNEYVRKDGAWVVNTDDTGIGDAPSDGNIYGRQNAGWAVVTGGGGISDAPSDGNEYLRKDGAWVVNTDEVGSGGGGSVHIDIADYVTNLDGSGDPATNSTQLQAAVTAAQAVGNDPNGRQLPVKLVGSGELTLDTTVEFGTTSVDFSGLLIVPKANRTSTTPLLRWSSGGSVPQACHVKLNLHGNHFIQDDIPQGAEFPLVQVDGLSGASSTFEVYGQYFSTLFQLAGETEKLFIRVHGQRGWRAYHELPGLSSPDTNEVFINTSEVGLIMHQDGNSESSGQYHFNCENPWQMSAQGTAATHGHPDGAHVQMASKKYARLAGTIRANNDPAGTLEIDDTGSFGGTYVFDNLCILGANNGPAMNVPGGLCLMGTLIVSQCKYTGTGVTLGDVAFCKGLHLVLDTNRYTDGLVIQSTMADNQSLFLEQRSDGAYGTNAVNSAKANFTVIHSGTELPITGCNSKDLTV